MRKILLISSIVLTSMIQVGCASSGSSTPSKNYVLIEPEQSALDEIKHISIEARDEMRLLAKYQEALAMESLSEQQHQQKFFQSVYIPPGFEQEVDLKITDSAVKVAEALAMIAEYRLDIEGMPSGKIPPVAIDIRNQPLNEALKELGAQTGDVIQIEVYPAAKLMLFRYNSDY